MEFLPDGDHENAVEAEKLQIDWEPEGSTHQII